MCTYSYRFSKMALLIKPFGCAVCRKGFESPLFLADHVETCEEQTNDQQKSNIANSLNNTGSARITRFLSKYPYST